jgi:hypothetical protein
MPSSRSLMAWLYEGMWWACGGVILAYAVATVCFVMAHATLWVLQKIVADA